MTTDLAALAQGGRTSVAGFVIRDLSPITSNWRAKESLDAYLARHHVVAMDVVEVAPAYDQADVTINVAHRLFTECLAGMGAKRRDAAGAPKGRPAR